MLLLTYREKCPHSQPGPLGYEALGSKPLSIEKRPYTEMAPLFLSSCNTSTLPVGSRAVL